MADHILIGTSSEGQRVHLRLDKANRHGLIAGATGFGKTTTLQMLAKSFSDEGVAVFAADVKGDLSGIAMPSDSMDMHNRARRNGMSAKPSAPPVRFLDVYGQSGDPIGTTVAAFGEAMMARVLELNEVQAGIMSILYHMAHKHGVHMASLFDVETGLREMLRNKEKVSAQHGNVMAGSVSTILRKILALNNAGVDKFFRDPAFDIKSLVAKRKHKGVINVLMADKLLHSPRLYSTFMFWLLSQLFEKLPEVGDQSKPRMVFFFDEAHLLFKDAPQSLIDKIEQVIRLVRSKGVGVYFITQSPSDIPDMVLSQLGNRIQHTIRAYTPRDERVVNAAARSYRPNPSIHTKTAITSMGVGQALVSVMDAQGVPTPVEMVSIRPPGTRLGPITQDERMLILAR